MIRVCAWCNRKMGRKPGPEGEITHGVCDDCYQHFFAEGGKDSIARFLGRLAEPVFFLDHDARLQAANPAAADLLGKELGTFEGTYAGDVIECSRARLPGGCGKTVHCKACAIRNTVTDTFATGRSHHRVTAFAGQGEPDGERTARYRISTEKVAGGVLLRIDEVDAEGPPGRDGSPGNRP